MHTRVKGCRIWEKLLSLKRDRRIDFSWIIIAVLIAWSLSTGLFPLQYKGLSTRTY